jgi:predicted transcriptional regulator
MKEQKRSRYEIYFDILSALYSESARGEKVSLTRIAHKSNLPYDRFQKLLKQLVEVDMISRDGSDVALTEKGKEYMVEFNRINCFLIRMGLLRKTALPPFSVVKEE